MDKPDADSVEVSHYRSDSGKRMTMLRYRIILAITGTERKYLPVMLELISFLLNIT